jgi:hypothetical protein
MEFHIVKMYKDKEVNKNVKTKDIQSNNNNNIVLSMLYGRNMSQD